MPRVSTEGACGVRVAVLPGGNHRRRLAMHITGIHIDPKRPNQRLDTIQMALGGARQPLTPVEGPHHRHALIHGMNYSLDEFDEWSERRYSIHSLPYTSSSTSSSHSLKSLA